MGTPTSRDLTGVVAESWVDLDGDAERVNPEARHYPGELFATSGRERIRGGQFSGGRWIPKGRV